jgi:hypothetical protein
MNKLSNIGYVPQQNRLRLSNQRVDVFKKRMEEAFAKPDELKHEIQNSSIKETKGTLIRIFLILLFMILITGGVYFVKVFMKKPTFCSEGIPEPCQPCPDFSVCESGDFKCNKNYIKEGYGCIEDKVIIQRAYSLLHKVEDYIIEKSNKEYLDTRSSFFIGINDIQYLFKDSEAVDEKMVELLITNKADRLTSKFYAGESIFYAKPPFLNVYTLVVVFWDDNMYYLVSGFILIVFLVYKLIRMKAQRLLRIKADHMYELIRNQLKANVDDTPEHGVPEETLKEVIAGHLGPHTTDLLWPIIENLRKKDKQVSKFETHLAGRPQILWQWKDVRTLKNKLG